MDLGGGYFSPKQAENPIMYNWNKVYLKYCDGASFSGNNATVQTYEGHKVYYRGYLNLQAYYKDLMAKHSLGKATHAVISGCSAGGLATYLHADWWAEHLQNVDTRAMPDSGFFVDYNAPGKGPKYGQNMRWVFEAQACKGGVNKACVEANKGKESNCMFAEHTAPHIKTPIFPLQSEYDSWQSANILGSNITQALNAFGKDLTKRFMATVLKQERNGGFLESCFHHCGKWDQITINGVKSGAAFQTWYNSKHGIYLQSKEYPCAPCCK